jgi:hypothetical protein
MLAQRGRMRCSVAFIRPSKNQKKIPPEVAWMTKLLHLMKSLWYCAAGMPFEQYHGLVDDRGKTCHM